MDALPDKVREALLRRFPGASVELNSVQGNGRVWGILEWDRFEGVEQLERQRWLREALEALQPSDRRHVSAILTMTPGERSDDDEDD